MSTPAGNGAGGCRVSVICTVRNEARHLPLAIASVLIPGVDELTSSPWCRRAGTDRRQEAIR